MTNSRDAGRRLTAAKNALFMAAMQPQKPAEEQATDVLRRVGVKPKDDRPATTAKRSANQQLAEAIAKTVIADPLGSLRGYFKREKAANAHEERRKAARAKPRGENERIVDE